jgi:hypothetical protein
MANELRRQLPPLSAVGLFNCRFLQHEAAFHLLEKGDVFLRFLGGRENEVDFWLA